MARANCTRSRDGAGVELARRRPGDHDGDGSVGAQRLLRPAHAYGPWDCPLLVWPVEHGDPSCALRLARLASLWSPPRASRGAGGHARRAQEP